MSDTPAKQDMDNKCPQCGAPLPSGVLAGLCPACLLKQGAAADTAAPPDAPPFQPPTIEEVAKLFPQLEILSFIGRGGMGAVYKARQLALDRVVALKILPAQTAGGPAFVERFNREARALARLTHPNIVTVYEFGQAGGLSFFIMEFVDGLNLRELERSGKLTPREALQIVPQICEALQFAHDEGIVHRDIKPENILVDKKGRIKIADFGIAKILGAAPGVAITETQGAIGTPHYMAPEQVERPAAVDHRADIFSLGVVFYEMLTGELPLGKFSPPSARKIEVDVRLDDVVLRALEKDPGRRYQHASQVKTAVDTIAGSAAPPPPISGEALAAQLSARDYTLSITSCLRRGWNLVWSDFWPIIGVNALITLLWMVAYGSGGLVTSGHDHKTVEGGVLGMLLNGPLMGGIYFYFLKRIRGESATVETAFAGFSNRVLQLFLASFVAMALTAVGFMCLILPGIYLMVAWELAIPLVIDKGLSGWAAMEVSRKIISKHWWKFFFFMIVLLLLRLAGLVVFLVGILIALPIVKAALMYAYEDIFTAAKTAPAGAVPAGVGPKGTEVRPSIPPQSPGGVWRWLGPVLAIFCLLFLFVTARAIKRHHDARFPAPFTSAVTTTESNPETVPAVNTNSPENAADANQVAETVPEKAENADSNAPPRLSLNDPARKTLVDRMDAAADITDVNEKDRLLEIIAKDAAKIGATDTVKLSLRQIQAPDDQNHTAKEAALILAKRDQRKDALEIARDITNPNIRNETLSELAQ